MAAKRACRALALLALSAAVAAPIAGCGRADARTPSVSGLPLPSGAQVIARQESCNPGASSYCGIEMVVLDKGYVSSQQLVLAERNRLRLRGWVGVSPDIGDEVANESSNDKLRVTYATAFADLKGIDLGWISRAWPIVSALDRTLFSGSPAMSVLLEVGAQ